MLVPAILLAALCISADTKVASVLARWCSAVKEAESRAPAATATLGEKVLHLIRMDEVTRQNLWLMDDPSLDVSRGASSGKQLGEILSGSTSAIQRN